MARNKRLPTSPLAVAERDIVIDYMTRNKGNAVKTAKDLSITRDTVRNILLKNGMKPESFRNKKI